ncbi:MAG TPA: ABC transporter permease [Candidatus Binatia bacterium]|nr:ABC transporter permease [Candidatus Binatia bacterium]
MNTPLNPEPEPRATASGVTPAALAATRPFYWSVRRELWEYRSIYLAPLAIGGVILIGYAFVLVGLPHAVRSAMTMNAQQQRDALAHPFQVSAGLIMAASFIVSFFYAIDTLYGERRDRSILFWKSMPVSDITTVLAKAFVLLVLLPMVSYVITALTEGIILLLSSAVIAANGLSVAAFWMQLMPIEGMRALLYHLISVHILWYAPFYCWLMLISAWSKRAPFLWALLPPFAVTIFERIVFHTAYVANFLTRRLAGGSDGGDMLDPEMKMVVHFVLTPGLWFGLLFAAAFLVAAAQIRRYRGPV